MANAMRKVCTRIGNGHQFLLSAHGGCGGHRFLLSTHGDHQFLLNTHGDHQFLLNTHGGHRRSAGRRLQNEKVGKFCSADHTSCGRAEQPVVKEPSPLLASISWFNGPAPSPRVRLHSTATTPDGSLESSSSPCCDASNPDGRPSADQLHYVFDRLGETLPALFKENLDYSLFHPKLVFEDNIRGTKTTGVEYLMSTISLLRIIGHLKFASIQFVILKMTKHPADGTIKVRWRIKGITVIKVLLKFWTFKFWSMEHVIKDNEEVWHDGFSVFYLGSDGLVHKLTTDKMLPDNDPLVENECPLPTKLALFSGLSPQLNTLDCLMSGESEQANELFKMGIVSLEKVV